MTASFLELIKLVEDLGWDYDRMSTSGQRTYDKVIEVLSELVEQKGEQ